MTKISIVIPVYNTERYLKRCLDSIIEQKIQDIQIICIDDASTDKSLEILKSYKDNRIEVYTNKENRGAGYCKNLGLTKCVGEYVCLIDSDDWIKKDSLNYLYNVATKENSDIVYFGMELIREFDNKCIARDYINNDSVEYVNYESGVIFMKQLLKCHRMNTGARKFFRRTLLKNKKIQFTEGTYNDDLEFTLYIYASAKKVTCVKKNIYIYMKRNKNSISCKGNTTEFWLQYIQILERVLDDLTRQYKGDVWKLICKDSIAKCINALYKENIYDDFVNKIESKNEDIRTYITNNILYSQYYNFNLKKLKKLKKLKNIYIYGAGNYACDMYRVLKLSGINIKGFIETNVKKEKKYLNKNVYSINNVDKKDAYIIIAVSDIYINEIKELLLKNKYKIVNLIEKI